MLDSVDRTVKSSRNVCCTTLSCRCSSGAGWSSAALGQAAMGSLGLGKVTVLTDFTNLLTSFLGDEKETILSRRLQDRSVRGQADALTLYLQICHEIPERQEDRIFEICNCESVGANTKVIQMRCLQVGF